LFLSLAGLPKEVMAYTATTAIHEMETEDMAGAVMKYANGAIATLTATTAAYPGFPEEITLYCEHGSAHIMGTNLAVQYSDGTEEHFGDDEGNAGAGADPMAFTRDHHQALIEDFLDALAGDRDPAIPGETALESHILIDAILLSSETGAAVRLS
jgi:predicted dehydrogenase